MLAKQWLNEVMNSYNFLSAPVQVAILNTFKCEAYIAGNRYMIWNDTDEY